MLTYTSMQCNTIEFECSAIPTVVVDQEGTICAINQPAQRFFSYLPDEPLGQSIAMLVPEALNASWNIVAQTTGVLEQMNGSHVFAAVQRGGATIPVRIITAPWNDKFLLKFICTNKP
jgi:PAS domain S-box-containing protein